MSAPVIHFIPSAELDSSANVDAFVRMCRSSEVLNAKTQFVQNTWDVGYFKGQNKVNRTVFSTLEAAAKSEAEPSLPPPFLNFAKAMIVYLHDRRPVESQSPRIAALRCLEAALRQQGKGSRPTAVDPEVLDAAVELGYAQVSPSVAYRWAGQLEALAKTMHANGFIDLRQPWCHGQKKPSESGTRISKEALEARKEKLPSREVAPQI